MNAKLSASNAHVGIFPSVAYCSTHHRESGSKNEARGRVLSFPSRLLFPPNKRSREAIGLKIPLSSIAYSPVDLEWSAGLNLFVPSIDKPKQCGLG